MLRPMLVATAVAVAALVLAVRAEASSYVRYGVQDDAWLLAGPGTLDERLTKLERLNGSWVWEGDRRTDARGFFSARVIAPRGSAIQLYARGGLGAVLVVR